MKYLKLLYLKYYDYMYDNFEMHRGNTININSKF